MIYKINDTLGIPGAVHLDDDDEDGPAEKDKVDQEQFQLENKDVARASRRQDSMSK